MPPIVLLTDFGLQDTYVAEMKSVLMQNGCHEILDLTHAVRPGNVRHGQFLLMTAFRWFPPDTVFVAVVDPGVGTDRRAVAVRYSERWFIAPDNGLLSFATSGTIHPITPDGRFPERISETFHGRDIFTPAAAFIHQDDRDCLGKPGRLHVVDPIGFVTEASETSTEVFHVDHFGNMVTGISNTLAGQVTVSVNGRHIRQHAPTFAAAGVKEPFLVPGSRGLLEIALRNGRAVDVTNSDIQQPIEVKPI